MKKFESGTILQQLIEVKKADQEEEMKLLKNHFSLTSESLKPINIIKSTLKEVVSVPDLKKSIINGIIRWTAGYVVKKVFINKTVNPWHTLLGIVVKVTVNSISTKNIDTVAINDDEIKPVKHHLFDTPNNQYDVPESV